MEEKNTLIVENDSINNLAIKIEGLIQEARQHIVSSVNTTMVYTYYEIGRYIVEDEQGGTGRAAYGKQILQDVSARLTERLGKGWSYPTLRKIRQFYLTYSNLIISDEQITTKNDALVELTLPSNANIYAQQYALYLPDKDMLQKKLQEWIDEQNQ